jgi:ABC-2 type transport system ATP-binding protein
MVADCAIEAIGLAKSYGSTRVLSDFDLRVDGGTVFSLLGPNGAGKTTTIRILSTLTSPDAGRASVAGFDVVRERSQVRRRISLTGQYAALDELQTGAENLWMIGRLRGLSRKQARQRSGELLEQFDLTDAAGRLVAHYSGGMRRRLDVAVGLVRRPAVIFLDEPTVGLDPRSRLSLWRSISELAHSGVTVFLTTQYLEEADRLADQITVINGGQVVASGTPEQLKKQAGGERLTVTCADADAFRQVTEAAGRRAFRADPDQLTVSLPAEGGAARVRALLDELDPERALVTRFDVQTATLDDVFLALTGHGDETPGAGA